MSVLTNNFFNGYEPTLNNAILALTILIINASISIGVLSIIICFSLRYILGTFDSKNRIFKNLSFHLGGGITFLLFNVYFIICVGGINWSSAYCVWNSIVILIFLIIFSGSWLLWLERKFPALYCARGVSLMPLLRFSQKENFCFEDILSIIDIGILPFVKLLELLGKFAFYSAIIIGCFSIASMFCFPAFMPEKTIYPLDMNNNDRAPLSIAVNSASESRDIQCISIIHNDFLSIPNKGNSIPLLSSKDCSESFIIWEKIPYCLSGFNGSLLLLSKKDSAVNKGMDMLSVDGILDNSCQHYIYYYDFQKRNISHKKITYLKKHNDELLIVGLNKNEFCSEAVIITNYNQKYYLTGFMPQQWVDAAAPNCCYAINCSYFIQLLEEYYERLEK